jgi:hypothetical protein
MREYRRECIDGTYQAVALAARSLARPLASCRRCMPVNPTALDIVPINRILIMMPVNVIIVIPPVYSAHAVRDLLTRPRLQIPRPRISGGVNGG